MGVGLHMILDGYAATPPTIATVQDFIGSIVKRAKLQVIAGPFFFKLESYEEAWAVIAESHIAIKWFPNGLVLIDVFSCKRFELDDLATFTVAAFGLEHWQVRGIQRMGLG